MLAEYVYSDITPSKLIISNDPILGKHDYNTYNRLQLFP